MCISQQGQRHLGLDLTIAKAQWKKINNEVNNTVKMGNGNMEVWLLEYQTNLCSAINEFGWFGARSQFLLEQQLLANIRMSLLVFYLITIPIDSV